MDNRILIADSGGIRLMVNLLRSVDPMIQENVVTSLLYMAINDDNKTAMTNAGAIGPLIHVLEIGTLDAQENAAATLFCLSMIKENKSQIGRLGAICPLVELLRNGTPRGKNHAAIALFNLSIFDDVQAGAVKHPVELMNPTAGMVDKAVAVLENLAMIPEGRTAIGQAGGIPVLVEVVVLGSTRDKENAAAALLQLCTTTSRFCNMVLQEGAVPPLVALSQSGTPRAKEKVIQAESLARRTRISVLEFFQLLKDSHHSLPSDLSSASLEHCIQKVKNIGCDLTSAAIAEAVKDHESGRGPSPEKAGENCRLPSPKVKSGDPH